MPTPARCHLTLRTTWIGLWVPVAAEIHTVFAVVEFRP
eukprot:gene19451-38800_t